jgi:hypothetical protein
VIDPSGVLAGLPKTLRDELLECYREIISNYLERRWEPSELNGGKFCEVVYSIINGALQGIFPPRATKPARMLDACQALEQVAAIPGRVGDRSCASSSRMLPVLYEVRNNRGVGHVGGDVDANHMDAEAVQGMASWVMAELVRIFHNVPTDEAREAVDALVERKTPLIWEVEGIKRVLDKRMTAPKKVLALLHHSTGWVPVTDLFKWVEYSNVSAFRSSVLKRLHEARLVEFDTEQDRVCISPKGIREAEANLRAPEET